MDLERFMENYTICRFLDFNHIFLYIFSKMWIIKIKEGLNYESIYIWQ